MDPIAPLNPPVNIENDIKIDPKESILLSKYIPILDELDNHVLFSKKIGLANNIMNETIRDMDQILQKKTQSNHDIEEVRKMRKKIHDLKEIIATLSHTLTPYENQIEIFRIESEMRKSLNKDFPEKQKFQEIFDQRVIPLLTQMKHLLIQNSNQITFRAAASKGNALQAGLQAITELTEGQRFISSSKVSSQDVFLLPEQNAVFKQMNERAEEEERVANSLLDLMSEEAYVGTFNIKTASRGNFGIQTPEQVKGRGYSLTELDGNLKNGILRHVPLEYRKLIENHDRQKNERINPNYSAYIGLKDMQLALKQPDKMWESVSFSTLQKLYFEEKLLPETLIGLDTSSPVPMKTHILEEDPFFQALNYSPTLQEEKTLYLAPDLKDPAIKKAYEYCEQFKWSYIDSINNKRETDFKTLHANHLKNLKMSSITCIPDKDGKTAAEEDFNKAITVNWKALVPELMKIEKTGAFPVRNVQAKPYISDMLLMSNLDPAQREILLNRLTPASEFHAILTGEIQLLDMHSKNLGIAPEPNAAYERFKKLKFTTSLDPSKEENLAQLMLAYAEGKIPLDSFITFNEGGSIISKPLKDLPDLLEVFKGKWKLVIFDTDLSLSEDNRLSLQTSSGVPGHLIPLRSVLLETDWKNKPLSKETIDRLLASDERDLRVRNWVQKEDAQIYKQLSPNVREGIKKEIAPIIKQYTLSEPRKNHQTATIKQLQNHFVRHFSHIDPLKTLKIWKKIENDLSNVTVYPNDTWESIAKRHRQHVDALKHMNPEGLKVGEKVKIDFDLTSFSFEAVRKRAKIASQLFPRITARQQDALMERQTRRKDYLNNYMALSESKFKGEELFTQMERFILNPTSPFTSIRRDELFAQLNKEKKFMLANPRKMGGFKQMLCQQCQPTYFNLMKSMYPLLADAYALNSEFFQSTVQAGINIGLHSQSLENIIITAKHYQRGICPEVRRKRMLSLAANLETQINLVKDPSFFGHWP